MSWVGRDTIGKGSLESALANAATLITAEPMQFGDDFKIRLILQLIKRISRFVRESPRYFNDTAKSRSLLPWPLPLPVNFSLKLDDADFSKYYLAFL